MVKGIKIWIVVVLGLIFLVPNSYSQSKFYIKPSVNYKFREGYLENSFLAQSGNVLKETEHFKPILKKFSTITSFNLGLGVGYKIGKNNRVELNWAQDLTGSFMDFQYYQYFSGTDIITGEYYEDFSLTTSPFSSFILNNRFELKYYQDISKNFSVCLGFGVHYTRTNIGDDSNPYLVKYEMEGGALNKVGDSIRFSRTLFSSTNKISPFLSLGFDYKINAGETYLFTLSSYYVLGFKEVEYTSHRATVYNATESNTYHFSSLSKGGGIYFEISREMDVSTIIVKSRKAWDKVSSWF